MVLELVEKQAPEMAVSAGMQVSRLSLSAFRNYAHLTLEVGGDPIVLAGDNGAGKTNILEAISLLAPGRGFRKAKLSEMDHRAQAMTAEAPAVACWAVAAEVATQKGDHSIGTARDAEAEEVDRRIVKINGKVMRGHAELSRVFSVLWLVPQMDLLFIEGNSARRKFLDRMVYGFDPDHAGRVLAYEQLMRERNRLLSQPGPRDDAWLGAIEGEMAEKALAIATARLASIERINHAMEMAGHSFPKAKVEIAGYIEDGLLRGDSALQIEQNLTSLWRASRPQDAMTGRTGQGAHKSRLFVYHKNKGNEAEFCSTGEQKALLLALILAQGRAIAHWHGQAPVLLLDEVVAHLDAKRRNELYEEICHMGAQAWLTGTDVALFGAFKPRAQMFHVSHARVEEL